MLKPLFVVPVILAFGAWAQPPAASPAPAAAAPMANPVRPTSENLAKAKKQYGYDCAMCHGENGNGKGDLVADMKLTLKDWTDPASLKDVSDGELFNIIKNGKGQMPGDGGRTKPDDLWAMVNLLRTFSKK
jgi:mono/diheme cytochrome c family protein